MDLVNVILFLCLTTLSGYVRASRTRDVDKKEQLFISDNKKQAISTSQCYCFPKNPQGKHVSVQISPNGEQQERLVLYLFKNKDNKITVYVPNKQKQRFLPDLTLDKDDKLEPLNTENVIELYDSYSKVATENNDGKEQDWKKLFDGSLSSDIYFPTHQSIDLESLRAFLPEILQFGTIHLNNKDSSEPSEILHTKPDKKSRFHVQKKYPGIHKFFLPKNLTVSSSESETSNLQETSAKYPSISDLILPGDLTVIQPSHEVTPPQDTSEISLDANNKTPQIKPNAPEHLSEIDQLKSIGNGVPEDYEDIHVTISKVPGSSKIYNQVNVPAVEFAIENKPTQLHLHTENDKLPQGPNTIPETSKLKTESETEADHDVAYNIPFHVKQIKLDQLSNQHHKILQNGRYIYVIDGINSRYIPYSENSESHIDPQVAEDIQTYVPKSPLSSLELSLSEPHLSQDHVDNEKILYSPRTEKAGQKILFVFPGNELNIQPKFEEWFQEQIEFIGRKRLFLLQAINQRQFKILILKALNKNGINLSESGDLIDSDGNVLNTSDLKLLPILLGDRFEHVQSISGKKCFTPYDLSFLKAVLVTLAYPPRILGIIPLGKTLKEKTYDSKKPCNFDTYEKDTSCEGNRCQMKKIKDKSIEVQSPDKLNNLSDGNHGSSTNLNPSVKSNSLLGSFINARRTDVDKENDVFIKDEQSLNYIDEPDEDLESDDTEDYESLGIRIIGGQAAISSGTPVSSKGRSGYVD